MKQHGYSVQSAAPVMQAGDIKKYDLNSNIFPCICVAMYETILDPAYVKERENEGLDDFYYITFNRDDYKKEMLLQAQEYINDRIISCLKNYGLESIETSDIDSPKYYNYRNDELDMVVSMQAGWKNIMLANIEKWRDSEKINKFISKEWKSYDGYINFMPESLDELINETDQEKQLAAYLTLSLLAENNLKDRYYMLDEFYAFYMCDFTDFKHNFVFEEYLDKPEAENMLKLWNDDFKFNELYWDLREKIGAPWHYQYNMLESCDDPDLSWNADSDGKRMLFWALKNGYTVNDLYKMVA